MAKWALTSLLLNRNHPKWIYCHVAFIVSFSLALQAFSHTPTTCIKLKHVLHYVPPQSRLFHKPQHVYCMLLCCFASPSKVPSSLSSISKAQLKFSCIQTFSNFCLHSKLRHCPCALTIPNFLFSFTLLQNHEQKTQFPLVLGHHPSVPELQ